MKMITKFSLYGFLKNMQFFEPFLILYFLQLGLNFFQIGLLISFRTICINIMEIPSGAMADLYGRKNSMVFSLSCYICSFIVFSFAQSYIILFPAVFLFSIGEAFRTGTHKAMIFDWLRQNNRLNEKTRVYGYTRSWSKIGSAVSVIISSLIIILLKEYRWIFIFTIIPYIIGIVNIINYPSYLNKKQKKGFISIKNIFLHLFDSIKHAILNKNLRKIIIQNIGFEGIFNVAKDYIQPILKAQAAVLAVILLFPEKDSTAVIVGIVYFVIYTMSAAAARNSHKIDKKIKSNTSALLILFAVVIMTISAIGLYFKLYILTIISFILYFVIQNIWRPILVSQYDNFANDNEQATILSIESQAKSIGIFFLAPVSGFFADSIGIYASLLIMSALLLLLYIYTVIKR